MSRSRPKVQYVAAGTAAKAAATARKYTTPAPTPKPPALRKPTLPPLDPNDPADRGRLDQRARWYQEDHPAATYEMAVAAVIAELPAAATYAAAKPTSGTVGQRKLDAAAKQDEKDRQAFHARVLLWANEHGVDYQTAFDAIMKQDGQAKRGY